MVYEKVKNIFTDKISKEGITVEKMAKLEVAGVKKDLNRYSIKTVFFINSLSYHGHKKDKDMYIVKLRVSLKKVLEDKKATKEEMKKFRERLNTRSEKLRQRMIEQQRGYEEMKFIEIKEKNNESIIKSNFFTSIKRLSDLKSSLSLLNITSGNLSERKLRLDLIIQEQINALKNLSKLYKAKYAKGNVFVSSTSKFYIHGVDNKGNITFSAFKHDENKKGARTVFGKRQKLNWIKFKKLTEEKGCKVTKFDKGEYKDINVDADKDVVESRAKIEELKRLKEINFLFSGKALEGIKNPEQRELIKKGIEEHYNAMRLYFEKDSDGIVKPTEIYSSLSVENRVKILIKMMIGVNQVIQRLKLEESVKKEKDPIKKMFLKGEVAFQNKNYMQAYAHFRAFKKKSEYWGYTKYKEQFDKLVSSWDLPGAIKIAESRLRQMSFHFINIGEKYVTAAVQQKAEGVFISGDVAKKTYKEAMGVFNKMRKALQSGKVYDLSTAWQKIGLPWYSARKDRTKGLKWSKLGRSETHLRIFHMPIIIKITEVALQTDKSKQKKMLLTLADDARKTKFRGAASVLYKEYMQDDLRKFEKGRMKTKEYWAAKRKRFMALKQSKDIFVVMFRDGAKEMAAKSVGEKFNKLPKDQQQALISRYEQSLLEREVNKGATKDLFKSFLKKTEGSNKAAAKYIDMEDPFDEWFNLSDEGNDTLKKYAAEAIILGCSGGMGNLAGRAATAGLRTLAKKSAEKLIVRLATSGAGIAVDMVVSEVIDRTIRTVLLGQKGLFSKKELMNFLKHSVATYGVLSLGGRVTRVAMKRMRNAGQLAQYAVRIGSAFGVEAPLMATLNHGFAGWEGKWTDHYGQSIMNILAARAGMKLLHASTDNMLLRAENHLMTKARLSNIKATNPVKGELLEGMLRNGESMASIERLMDSDLSVKQMKDLSKYMDDPKNAGFLLALKYAEQTGTMTKKMKDQYQEYLLDLRMMGFTKRQAAKFARSITLEGLLRKHGEGAKRVSEGQLDRAISQQKREAAKAYLKANTKKIIDWLKKPRIKKAFETFVLKCQGNYKKFIKKYPGLARIMPKNLKELGVLPVTAVEEATLGMPLTALTNREMSKVNNLKPKTNLDKVIAGLGPNGYYVPNVTDLLLKFNQNEIKKFLEVDGMKEALIILVQVDISDNRKVKKLCDKFKGHIDLEKAFLTYQRNELIRISGREDEIGAFWIRLINTQSAFPDFKNPLDIKMLKQDAHKIIEEALYMAKKSWDMEAIMQKLYNTGITQNEMARIVDENVYSILRGIKERGKVHIDQIDSVLLFYEAAGISKNKLFKKLKETASHLFNQEGDFHFAKVLDEKYGIRIEELDDTDILSKNPYGYEYRGLKKTEYMAFMYRAWNKIPYLYRRQWNVERLFKQMERMYPKHVGTKKQKDLVKKMLRKMKKVQEMIDMFKETGKLEKIARGFLDTQSRFLRDYNDFPLKVKIVEDHMFIYVPKKILKAMLKGIQNKTEFDVFVSSTEYKGVFGDAYHFTNYIDKEHDTRFGMVSIMPLEFLKKGFRGISHSIGKHEAMHGETAFLEIGYNYWKRLVPEIEKALENNNYKQYINKQFQYLLQLRVRDEIYSYMTDGRLQSQGAEKFYKWMENTYLKLNLPELNWDDFPADQRESIKQYYNKMETKYKYLALKAIENASKIIQYPNGFALLRLTDISHWSHLLRDLKKEYDTRPQ